MAKVLVAVLAVAVPSAKVATLKQKNKKISPMVFTIGDFSSE